jgi:hypothetical protein
MKILNSRKFYKNAYKLITKRGHQQKNYLVIHFLVDIIDFIDFLTVIDYKLLNIN